jgi:xylose isomerase
MSAAYFNAFDTVRYEGPDSANDLAYRWYDKDRVVFGKRMEDYLRFAVCMWHTFCWPGSDVFGAGTFDRPWLNGPQDEAAARAKREAALAFVEKLDLPFYCFHDVDVMAPAESIGEFRALRPRGRSSGGTAGRAWPQAAGARPTCSATRAIWRARPRPRPEVYAWGASQVRDALEATHRLGGANYVLWGGARAMTRSSTPIWRWSRRTSAASSAWWSNTSTRSASTARS